VTEHGGVVDHDDVARERERGEVRGAQQRAGAGGAERQVELLPGMAGTVHEPPRRLEDLVGVLPQRGQPRGELPRPALDAAELGARGGAGVDGDAVTGQRA
jgi:hypothetical protein